VSAATDTLKRVYTLVVCAVQTTPDSFGGQPTNRTWQAEGSGLGSAALSHPSL